jgi:hypothetical protein
LIASSDHIGSFSLTLIACTIAACVVASYAPLSVTSDGVSQLPLVLRVLDPSYLSLDPYVDEMSRLSVRSLPTYIVAAIASLVGLDSALLLLHLCTLAIAAYGAWLLAHGVFSASAPVALLSSVLVLTLDGPYFGNALAISWHMMTPRELSRALVLLALAYWLVKRPRLSIALMLTAAVFQPAYPLWIGGAMASFAVTRSRTADSRSAIPATFVIFVLALFLIAVAEYLILGPADRLVGLVAYFRNPHHLLLSHQSPLGAFWTMSIVIGSLVAVRVMPGRVLPTAEEAMTWVLCAVVVLATAGYILVEIVPTRTGLAIQFGRYFFLAFALLIIAGLAASERILTRLLPVLVSAIGRGWALLEHWSARVYAPVFASVLSAVVLFAPMAFPATGPVLAARLGYAPELMAIEWGGRPVRARRHADIVALATEARRLPEDAVILAPPDFGLVRIVGRRALFVDFKAWSFTAPFSWASRMERAYGYLTVPGGFRWMRKAKVDWADTTCSDLIARAQILGATHVVIEKGDMNCGEPTIVAGRFSVLPVP